MIKTVLLLSFVWFFSLGRLCAKELSPGLLQREYPSPAELKAVMDDFRRAPLEEPKELMLLLYQFQGRFVKVLVNNVFVLNKKITASEVGDQEEERKFVSLNGERVVLVVEVAHSQCYEFELNILNGSLIALSLEQGGVVIRQTRPAGDSGLQRARSYASDKDIEVRILKPELSRRHRSK